MDMPFTTEQFFEIIAKYNSAMFPAQIILLLLGAASIALLHSKMEMRNRLIGLFLGVLWLWAGAAYHLACFTIINKAAWGFGVLFIIQGLMFTIASFKGGLEFEFKNQASDWVAYFFLLFGLVVYPVLLYFIEGSLDYTIVLGLPCPSTIFTFGMLMMVKPRMKKYLIIIPVIWMAIGTTAAFNFGVYPDYMLAVSGLTALVFTFMKPKAVQ